MVFRQQYQIVVIGAGSGGLVVAIGAAKAGKKVLLIEKGLFGGDCTNFGCVPSKSLIASAKVAHSIKKAKDFGLEGIFLFTEAKNAFKRVRNIILSMRSHEDPEALNKKGVSRQS